jgi:hypothetical protein
MNKLLQIIQEEISAIRKDKDNEIFDYHSIVEDAWREPKTKAQEFQRIHFDFENDDSTGEKKTIYIKKNLRKNQPVKYEIQAELFEAGGDWEMSVMYFRIEFTHQYGILSDKYQKKPEYVWDLKRDYSGLYHSFVLIPPVEAGNKLIKGESDSGKYDWFTYQNNDLSKEEEKLARITDVDRKNAWKWLEDLLLKVVNDRHEMLDDDNDDDTPKDTAEPINEDKKKSDYTETKESLMRSKSIGKEMKEEILKYVSSGSKYHGGGVITGLVIPKIEGKSFKGVSMGGDKDGFFVYTHRARSKSHPTPEKITKKEINFIESTG